MTEEQRKRREQFRQERDAWKKKYGEITLLDFPQFTRDTYPGVTKMDLFSGHFGDVADDSQFLKAVPHIRKAIESFRELAEHGEKVGVKVSIENHWGIAADPMTIRIIIEEVASPFCEASPDFCNWEHEYMLYHGLAALAPYSSTMVHAKRWTRFPDVDIARCVRIMTNAGYRGYFAAEFEEQSDGVLGSKKIMEEVLAAL
jgi:sugar phosphate isomerase/epimerase